MPMPLSTTWINRPPSAASAAAEVLYALTHFPSFLVLLASITGKEVVEEPPSTPRTNVIALMEALGHERFAVVGHDTGFAISYALAAGGYAAAARKRRLARFAQNALFAAFASTVVAP